MGEIPTAADLLRTVRVSADHLELRDTYDRNDPAFRAWQNDPDRFRPEQWYTDWTELVAQTTRRGVRVRRARVVTAPVSDYITFEHVVTPAVNLAAGEQVRWLIRGDATGIELPVNDFWLVDDTSLLTHYFSADGTKTGAEFTSDVALVAAARAVFDAIWARAVPHADVLV